MNQEMYLAKFALPRFTRRRSHPIAFLRIGVDLPAHEDKKYTPIFYTV